MNYYAMANGYNLRIVKLIPLGLGIFVNLEYPFRCSISQDKMRVGFSNKTLKSEHNCDPCYKNPREVISTILEEKSTPSVPI